MMKFQTEADLRDWLANLKLAHLAESFIAGGWWGEKLLKLTREKLADLGVPKDQRGAVMLSVETLRQGDAPPTLPDHQAPNYAPALTEVAIARCQALGQQPPIPWVETVADAWPGPIAHEYQHLRQLLEQGQIVAAIFQLKDLAEVLVKFPALVMARDLIEHGDPEAARVARRSLFGGLLSFGHWVDGIVGQQLVPQVRRLCPQPGPTRQLLFPELGAVFVTVGKSGKEAASPWRKTLKDLVSWRNENLGHGAFHLDPQEYLPDLEQWLSAINRHLAEQVAQGLWADAVLRGEAGTPLFTGWWAIRHWHDGDAGAPREFEEPLVLARAGRTLRLTPLVTLRRCAVCAKQDVFLYDTRKGCDPSSDFVLLDYLSGHRLTLPAHRAGELAAETHDLDGREWLPPDPGLLDDDYGERAINELLETRLLEARYLRPDYLREPLRRFVAARDRGVFWLTAPSHTGKSVFAHGLVCPAEVGDKPLWPDTAVVVFHIRREFKTWPEQLRYFILETVLHQAFGREPGRLRLPELDVQAADPAAALARLLHEAFRLKPDRIRRLVLILDGLDELPPNPEGKAGIADFIPRPEALPDGCFLLLTSRPLAECPPHIRHALADRFAGCVDFAGYALSLDDASSAAYRQLLHAYFDRELADRLKAELHQALAGVVQGQTTVICHEDLGQIQSSALREFARTEWQALKQTHGVKKVRSPREAPSLKETVVQPLLDCYGAAFDEVVRKATSRFLYVAHLTELLRDDRLAFAGIADLPAGAGLYAHYLRQLERTLAAPGEAAAVAKTDTSNKPWEFARRVILTLAAAEQAHVACQAFLPASIHDDGFHGIPQAILAALLDEPDRTVRLTFTLYSLKGILTAWKGEDARDACYALGLKDFVQTVAALWPEALTDYHRLLATQTLEALGAVEAIWEQLDLLDQWRLQYLVAHVVLSGQATLRQQVIAAKGIKKALHRLSLGTFSSARYAAAACYSTYELVITEWSLSQQETPSALVDLAKAYINRGRPRAGGGDIAGAIADYSAAIRLLENLRQQVGTDWLPTWSDTLADAFMERGCTYGTRGYLTEAQADSSAAITLWKDTRRQIGPKWPPDWARKLAGAYINRGNVHANSSNLNEAYADHDTAIRLLDNLRQRMGTNWPPSWDDDRASAYMNRGNVCDSRGDLIGARTDYDVSIALQEHLCVIDGGARSPAITNSLAVSYTNRGNIRSVGGDIAGALADYDKAIALMTDLCQRIGLDWSPGLTNTLAQICQNRAGAHSAGGNLAGALADYDKAIMLLEKLRKTPGVEWPPAWTQNLAGFYHNRGKRRSTDHNWTGARADYDTAIALMVELRQQVEPNWPPACARDLAGIYANRGALRSASDDVAGGLIDYKTAIEQMEHLRQQIGENWPRVWDNHLASIYMNRGIELRNINHTKEALVDWDQAAQLYLNLLKKDSPEMAFTQLLSIAIYQIDGFRTLNDWPMVARWVLHFLVFHDLVESYWAASDSDSKPPWRSKTVDFFRMINEFNMEQRIALLDALGANADRVKKLLGWQ
jgi:tetratricopeptide (TPR) repeat protein